MTGSLKLICRLFQRINNFYIRHCRKFNRRVFLRGSFHADCTACDYHISAFDIKLHTSAGSYPDKGSRTALVQFFHCNGCRGASYSCRGYAHFNSVQITGISHKFATIRNKLRIIQELCYQLTAFRVSRQQDILSYILWSGLNMIWHSRAFCIINHASPS